MPPLAALKHYQITEIVDFDVEFCEVLFAL